MRTLKKTKKAQVPRYNYKCRECGVEFQISHSIHDKLTNCGDCKTDGSLFRLITSFATTGLESRPTEKKQKPGKIVNEFIENAKSEMDEYKNKITEGLASVEDMGE